MTQVSGTVTYNGHAMNGFVPQRSSAYISQHDLHIGELTVRETLAFPASSQGVGLVNGGGNCLVIETKKNLSFL